MLWNTIAPAISSDLCSARAAEIRLEDEIVSARRKCQVGMKRDLLGTDDSRDYEY